MYIHQNILHCIQIIIDFKISFMLNVLLNIQKY